jgi:hypothetical protein
LPEDDVAHLPAFPPGFADGLLKDESRPVLKLCPADATTCTDLHVGQALAGHFDDDNKRVVITSFDDGKLTAHIYDTVTRARSAVWPVTESAIPDCSFAAFVGERLLISSGACTGGGKTWLADPETGDKIVDVGKRDDAFVRDGHYARVDGKLWAFRDASGKRVYLQDVASGEVSATVDLDAVAEGTKAKDDAAFVLATADMLVLVEARPLVGTVFLANPKDGSVTKSYVPRPCP